MAYQEEEVAGDEERPADVVECPSGLRGRIRKLKLGEVQRFFTSKGLRSGDAFESALKDCWVEMLDTGPAYGEGFNWDDALTGDRFAALLAIRAHTYGPDFTFKVQCPAGGCRKRFDWTLDLQQLHVKPYPVESLEKYRAGEDFVGEVAGKQVHYRLSTGKTEKALRKLLDDSREEAERMVEAVAYRMVRVEGLEDKQGRPDRHAIRKWVRDMPADEFARFRDCMHDAVEGGVDTALLVRCEACGEEFRVELPFGSAELWSPRAKR